MPNRAGTIRACPITTARSHLGVSRAAHRLAEHLARERIAPALVLCSTALRATATLDAIMPALEPASEARLAEDLYSASTEDLVRRLHTIPAPVPSVMLIGHNPTIQSAALLLARKGDGALFARLRDKMPTGALVTLELGGEWSAAAAGTARLVSFVVPRDLA